MLRAALLALAGGVLAGCGGGGGGTEMLPGTPPVTVNPLQPPAAPAVVADGARAAMAGPNGVRAALSFTADWDALNCVTLTVFNRHASAALQAWTAAVDFGAWELQSAAGGLAAGATGIVNFRAEALAPSIAAGASGQARFCMKPRATPSRRPVLISIGGDLPAPSADPYETGLWRIVSASTRLTMGWQISDGRFKTAAYSGHPDQQFRLKARATQGYDLMLESRGQCLASAGQAMPGGWGWGPGISPESN